RDGVRAAAHPAASTDRTAGQAQRDRARAPARRRSVDRGGDVLRRRARRRGEEPARPARGHEERRVVSAANTTRVLPAAPMTQLDDYVRNGGGQGMAAARRLGPDATVDHLAAAGLRGRGGAGFPTARKWSSVRAREASALPATVVVNAAEGEPGTFKDRTILRRNPFAVLEGALIAAATVDADRVIVAVKASFTEETAVLRQA